MMAIYYTRHGQDSNWKPWLRVYVDFISQGRHVGPTHPKIWTNIPGFP